MYFPGGVGYYEAKMDFVSHGNCLFGKMLFKRFLFESSKFGFKMTENSELTVFQKDNEGYREWFNNSFIPNLVKVFPSLENKIELTGSRWFGLAYQESDLECAIILEESEHSTWFDMVSTHFNDVCHDSKIEQTKTLAGLLLLTIKHFYKDASVNIWKLEITFRTPEKHKIICDAIREKMKHMTDEFKLNYIKGARKDFIAMTTVEETSPEFREVQLSYGKRKEWLRVLPKEIK